MRKIIDLTNKRFGRFTVISRAGSDKWNNSFWLCRCDCGTEKKVTAGNLKSGNTKSCGCLCNESRYKHGCANHALYETWDNMMRRCNNPNNKDFANYGDRGIKVCGRWHNPENFLKDIESIGDKPTNRHTLDRIDNKEGYNLNNVKWSSPREQCNNKRTNVFIEYEGQSKTIAQWARVKNLHPGTLWFRLFKHNWSIHDAITTPVKNKLP